MTTGVVQFVTADFLARYPEFTQLNATNASVLGLCFDEAALYLDNSTSSRVVNVEQRTPLLYMLTAHIAALYFGVNGQAAPQTVGRVSDAGEGSVNASLDMGDVTFNAAWFMQTKYGASYWRATAKWRQVQVIPGCSTTAPNIVPPFGWGGNNGPWN